MKKLLITGATGFLGRAIAISLHELGYAVTASGRNSLVGATLTAQGIPFQAANLVDAAPIAALCAGQEMVIHCGAKTGPWGRYADYYAANVLGTSHVVQGCIQHGVARLIHISTPSLYFYHQARLDVREDDPLPPRLSPYAESKRLAEMEVAVGQRAGLGSIILRPRAIFGPGDTTLLPRLLEAMRQRRLPIIGDGQTITDLTYIDNVVAAVRLALDAPPQLEGRAINLTNGEPLALWPLVNQLCDQLGYPRPRRRIPFGLAFGLATGLEAIHKWIPGQPEPLLTRYVVGVLGKTQTLNIEAARRWLGYAPHISLEAGIQRTLAAMGDAPWQPY